MKRNHSLEVLKLYFAVSIAIGHSLVTSIFPQIDSNCAVLMFYVISGYFLVSSYDSGRYQTVGAYSFSRIKRIYPYYAAAYLILYVYYAWLYKYGWGSLIKEFLYGLPELFMLQGIGFFVGEINYPLWQLSCLIIVSHIMFAALIWNRQATLNIICPVLSICVLTYLGNAFDGISVDIWGVEAEFIYVPLLRTAGSVAIGMIIYYPVKTAVRYLDECRSPYLPAIISVSCIPLFCAWWMTSYSFTAVIPFVFMLICLLYSKNIFERMLRGRIFKRLDKLSLGVYLNHVFVGRFLYNHSAAYRNLPQLYMEIVYLTVLIAFCVVMMSAVDLAMIGIKKTLKRLQIIT